MAKGRPTKAGQLIGKIRNSGKTKNILVFLIFVCIAAVFWLILALNDEVQDAFDVRFAVEGQPDSVTFVTVPPQRLRVAVRDRGTSLLRHRITGDLTLRLNFEEYADGDRFRVSHSMLNASMRHLFGANATVSSVTPDSLNLLFTRKPGRRTPVESRYNVTVAPGMVLSGATLSSNVVNLYSNQPMDTIRRLYTEEITLRDIDKTTTVEVPLRYPSGTRAIPSTVKVTFNVEQLVKKEAEVAVEADNIPLGQDILFFPSKVRVAYFVPMSHYNETPSIRVQASFNEAVRTSSDKVGVRVVSKAPYMNNVELLADSVEYTLVRAN